MCSMSRSLKKFTTDDDDGRQVMAIAHMTRVMRAKNDMLMTATRLFINFNFRSYKNKMFFGFYHSQLPTGNI
jgi:hypothetical protein